MNILYRVNFHCFIKEKSAEIAFGNRTGNFTLTDIAGWSNFWNLLESDIKKNIKKKSLNHSGSDDDILIQFTDVIVLPWQKENDDRHQS